ncbi:MAG: dipeptidase [Planctomycetales bacterium]|nr:dipeptidase [Planctomycetales bacterium]MBN8625940.1 dipeptidase [Planctomycetota bacterium]
MPAAVDQYLAENAAAFEEQLCQLLRIPSVSAQSTHKGDIRAAAEWVAGQFRDMGMKAEICETPGHPIVYAELCQAPGAPTALVYGHYDVQPPDPLDLWETPPFEPTRRNGNLYARGATDDKGQMFTHVKSAEAWLKTVGKLPINLKFLIEGEEEVGSEHLDDYIRLNRERLKCDVCVISDTSQFGPGLPAITYGLRGISYFELKLQGPDRDLHSGVFGGAVVNPANALVKMLTALVDDQGRVQVPGFYDDVTPLTERERKEFAALPYDEAEFKSAIGVKELNGEADFTNIERRWARPTCDINGLTSGYQGEGAKTVLPAKASAKFSFRLVPNQDPANLKAALETFLKERCPAGITMELIGYHGAPGVVVPLESPYVAAAVKAVEHGFGRRPVFIREGGSIPVVSTFHDLLGVDTLLLGWGLNDDNTHSPNEKFCLADFHRGIKTSAALWEELGRVKT